MKHIVRKKTKKIRDKIPAQVIKKRSLAIFRNFCAAFKSKLHLFRHVMIYMSVQSEVKTGPFFKLFSDNKSKVYVPCVCGSQITPMLMDRNMECKPAAFGIPEPVRKIRIKTLKNLDLIIVPGIAFDRHGNRIGFGKGFFDKFLKQLPAKTLKVALAFSSQIVKKTHAKKHDVKMDYIVTEKEVIITIETRHGVSLQLTKEVNMKLLKSEQIYKGRVVNLSKDTIKMGKKTIVRELIKHPGSVLIIPILDIKKKKIVLINQYRYAAGGYIYEFPAGTRDDRESFMSCALRELTEEIGYTAGRIKEITKFFLAPGTSNEVMAIFIAYSLEKSKQNLDEDEQITPFVTTLASAVDMVFSGRIKDSKTIAGILVLKNIFDDKKLYKKYFG